MYVSNYNGGDGDGRRSGSRGRSLGRSCGRGRGRPHGNGALGGGQGGRRGQGQISADKTHGGARAAQTQQGTHTCYDCSHIMVFMYVVYNVWLGMHYYTSVVLIIFAFALGGWQWQKNTPQQNREMLFSGTPRLKVCMPQDASLLDYFKLFLTNEITNLILVKKRFGNSKHQNWPPINMNNLQRCSALIMLTGIIKKPTLQ